MRANNQLELFREKEKSVSLPNETLEMAAALLAELMISVTERNAEPVESGRLRNE